MWSAEFSVIFHSLLIFHKPSTDPSFSNNLSTTLNVLQENFTQPLPVLNYVTSSKIYIPQLRTLQPSADPSFSVISLISNWSFTCSPILLHSLSYERLLILWSGTAWLQHHMYRFSALSTTRFGISSHLVMAGSFEAPVVSLLSPVLVAAKLELNSVFGKDTPKLWTNLPGFIKKSGEK